MPTLSQFKSKYIIERRSKNIGDDGTKNIVKKLLGSNATPDDGGKSGQARIEKEFDLNKTNNTTSSNNNTSKNRTRVKKLSNTSKTVNFSSGATGTTPSGSVDLANTDKNFVQNRRTPINVNKSNTSALNVSNTKNVVKTDKFSDVKKFQDLNKRAQEILNKSNNTNSVKSSIEDISKKNKINKIPQSEVKPIKPNNVINAVNKTSRTVNLPDVKPNTSSLNVKNIRNSVSLPNFVKGRTRQGNLITQNLSNYKDPEVDKLIKDAENLKNPKSLKAYKQVKKDFKSFVSNPKVIRKISPAAKVLSGVGAALDARGDYKQSRDMGYNKVQSLIRTGVIGTGKFIGGVKGAALGTKVLPFGGTVVGGIAGYNLGGTTAQKAFDTLATNKGRRRLKKTFTNFIDNVRGKK